MKTIRDELAEHAFFRDLGDEIIDLLAGCGKNVHFKAGEYIFRDGDRADYFYFLRKGSVALEVHSDRKGALTIQTEGEGEVIGVSWLFPPYLSLMDGRAVDDVRAVAMDGQCLREKCEADPAVGYVVVQRFAQILIERLKFTRMRLLDVYGSEF